MNQAGHKKWTVCIIRGLFAQKELKIGGYYGKKSIGNFFWKENEQL